VLLTRFAEHRPYSEVEFFGFTDLLVVSDAVGLSGAWIGQRIRTTTSLIRLRIMARFLSLRGRNFPKGLLRTTAMFRRFF
jgi:hypothetical protein